MKFGLVVKLKDGTQSTTSGFDMSMVVPVVDSIKNALLKNSSLVIEEIGTGRKIETSMDNVYSIELVIQR